MNNKFKLIINITVIGIITCILSLSVNQIIKDKLLYSGNFAPVNINIEIDKNHIDNIEIVTMPDNIRRIPYPTTQSNYILKNIILHTEINEPIDQIKLIIIREDPNIVISYIDNITVFIGNTAQYFNNLSLNNNSEILIPDSNNRYNDLNYILNLIMSVLLQPYCYMLICILLFSLYYTNIGFFGNIIKNKYFEYILLFFILFFAFLLRYNYAGIKSPWVDELYSAGIAANPNSSLKNIFKDPGNPPFYYFLLRIWFTVTGWSETQGYLLSTILGISGITALYFLIKNICGRKMAVISAFLLTVSYTSIGFSAEMRVFILLMLLSVLIAYIFIDLLNNNSQKKLIIYAVLGAILVNSHYFGILFIIGNFVYYLLYNRQKNKKNGISSFFLINVIIGFSFLPFLLMLFKFNVVTNPDFNSWIPKPDINYLKFGLFCIILYLFISYISKKQLIKNIYNINERILVKYSVYIFSFVYLSSVIISLSRPVFTWRYMSICFPFMVIVIAYIIFLPVKIIKNNNFFNKTIKYLCTVLLLFFSVNYLYNLDKFGGKASDIYKVSQEYISLDSKNHIYSKQINAWWHYDDYIKFFGFEPLPLYDPHNDTDTKILYMSSLSTLNETIEKREIGNNLINTNNVLILRYGSRNIYKIIKE